MNRILSQSIPPTTPPLPLPDLSHPSFFDEMLSWIAQNLPATVGAILLASVGALVAWWRARFDGKLEERKKADQAVQLPAPTAVSADEVLAQYRVDVARRGSVLSFGDPSSWTFDHRDSLVTLDQLWTPLRVADSHSRVGRSGTHENMAEEDAGVDLAKLVFETGDDLLIVGGPGSGKSTSIASLAVRYARGEPASHRIPIWVSLASLGEPGRTIDPIEYLIRKTPEFELAEARHGADAGRSLLHQLLAAVRREQVVVLFDGLDEVKEHSLPRVRQLLSDIITSRYGVRVIVTCRSFDYRQKSPNRRLPISRELELLPYTHDDMVAYVRRWYVASVQVGRFNVGQAEDLRSALVGALGDPQIRELATSPLLLALLTLIHSEEAKLPDTMAVLCDRAITYMLADAARWRVRQAGAETTALPPVLGLAISVAHRALEAEETSTVAEASGIPLELIDEEAAAMCKAMEAAETGREPPSPADLVHRLIRGHGLLLERSQGSFAFAHRLFQEFLSGQYYATGAHHEEALLRASSPIWREPFRMMASFAGHEGGNLFYILAFISDLAFRDDGSPAQMQLAGEMLTEIGRQRLALNRFHQALAETDEPGALWRRVRSALNAQVEDLRLTLVERERAAAVVATMGDLRFPTTIDPDVTYPLVSIPARRHSIGSCRPETDEVARMGGFVGAPREVDLDSFLLGKYLVTNADYGQFIESGGYSNVRYWSEWGWAWVSGDSDMVHRIRDHWLSTVHEHHSKEIRDREIRVEKIEEEAVLRTCPRDTPFYWSDRRFNQLNRPVVGVNWWEASAYCKWLTEAPRGSKALPAGWSYRLPSEFEWEAAYRLGVDDVLFPWGDEWRDDLGHVSSNLLNMHAPCPVGIYPPTEIGAYDLAGNVWEWTSSLFLDFGVDHDDARGFVDSFEERVVRGSSWYNVGGVAMCSARAVDRSYNLFYDVGFRVAASA